MEILFQELDIIIIIFFIFFGYYTNGGEDVYSIITGLVMVVNGGQLWK